jgi:hypothetical protein
MKYDDDDGLAWLFFNAVIRQCDNPATAGQVMLIALLLFFFPKSGITIPYPELSEQVTVFS